MDLELSTSDLFAAAAGQPTSRELTPEDIEKVASYKAIKDLCRELCFQPPCECNICLRQYRTKDDQNIIVWYYIGEVKDPRSRARSYVESIKEDREFLFQKIVTSGPSFVKRWRSSEEEREEYLKTAQPEIYPFAQPLIEIASRAKKLHEARKYKKAYLLPYINIEDLSKDSANLIHLLHNRTIFPPQEWVHFDNAQLQPAWKQGGPGEKSAEGCIIMQGEHYGNWREFDRAAVHHGDAYGAIRGLVILEAQQILMTFLRNVVTTVLKDVGIPNPRNIKPQQSSRGPPSAAFPSYDLTSCKKWMRFIEAKPHRDQAWLSVASIYTQQPYSAPSRFDIDAMIEIAETKAMEAADELWLLQTDLDYFHDLMKRHEREWLDSVPRIDELKKFSPKDKMDNIGYIMTVKVVIQARDWQWLLEECQNVKRIVEESEANTHMGMPLTFLHETALCGLHYLLRESQSWFQSSLSKLFLKSQVFHSLMEVTAVGKDDRDSWALGFNFKNYPQLYQKDRIGWCLYNLTKNPQDKFTFERSVVLQHLEKFLETCPPQEMERIDREMYKCISDMAAVERMLSMLELHRPHFASDIYFYFFQPRQAWGVHSKLLLKPSKLDCKSMDLGSALESSARFRMPGGIRNEQWLIQRDQAQQNLSNLWEKARHVYQRMLEASDVSQDLIEPQLALMKQGDSPEHKAQLDLERHQILGRLRTARQTAVSKSTIPPKNGTDDFQIHRDQPASHIQEPAKEKIKTRPDASSTSGDLHREYAAALANLTIHDNDINESEKPAPILYTLKRKSMAFQVIAMMFPDRSKGTEETGRAINWLDFVSTMNTLGFSAEHRGGSGFKFRGEIMLPDTIPRPQKRSFAVHRPHPDPKMSPVLLQSLGKRCNRRFGWKRANFAVDGGGVEQRT